MVVFESVLKFTNSSLLNYSTLNALSKEDIHSLIEFNYTANSYPSVRSLANYKFKPHQDGVCIRISLKSHVKYENPFSVNNKWMASMVKQHLPKELFDICKITQEPVNDTVEEISEEVKEPDNKLPGDEVCHFTEPVSIPERDNNVEPPSTGHYDHEYEEFETFDNPPQKCERAFVDNGPNGFSDGVDDSSNAIGDGLDDVHEDEREPMKSDNPIEIKHDDGKIMYGSILTIAYLSSMFYILK